MSNRRNFVQKVVWALAGSGLLQSLSGSAYATGAAEINAGHLSMEGDDLARIKELLNGKAPLKWLFTGDSITQGAKHLVLRIIADAREGIDRGALRALPERMPG